MADSTAKSAVASTCRDGATVFTFPTSMGPDACDKGGAAIMAALDGSDTKVVFDMAGVTYICSAFIRLCVQALKKQGRDKFKLVNTSPDIKKVFKITGLDSQIPIE